MANLGFPSAAKFLINRLNELPQIPHIVSLYQWVGWLRNKTAWNHTWEIYYHNRHKSLGNQLQRLNRLANSQQINLSFFSHIFLSHPYDPIHPNAETTKYLLPFWNDPDENVQYYVINWLRNINSEPAFDKIYQFWNRNRSPENEKLILEIKYNPPLTSRENCLIYFNSQRFGKPGTLNKARTFKNL